jgi:short-subunit dehydrogenase
MKLKDSNVLLTGASGGIGREIAFALARRGARLAIVGREATRLEEVASQIRRRGGHVVTIVADLQHSRECHRVVRDALDPASGLGAVDAAVFASGLNDCAVFEHQSEKALAQMFAVNVLAPMAITRRLLPHLESHGGGSLLYVGSIFGLLGFPYFAAYSATKFALRGFTEALRRELAGRRIRVVHVAPRAAKTAMTDAYREMTLGGGMNVDLADNVALEIVAALERGDRERLLGFPESLFARLNGVVPRLIDAALGRQAKKLRPHAEAATRRTLLARTWKRDPSPPRTDLATPVNGSP